MLWQYLPMCHFSPSQRRKGKEGSIMMNSSGWSLIHCINACQTCLWWSKPEGTRELDWCGLGPVLLLCFLNQAVAGSECSNVGSFIQTIRQVPRGPPGEAKFVCSREEGLLLGSGGLSQDHITGTGEACAQQAINSSVFLHHSALRDMAKASSRQWLMGWYPTALDWIKATHSPSLCLLFAGSHPTKLTSLVVVFSFDLHPLFQYFPYDFISFVR